MSVKKQLFEQFALVGKALSSASRLELLDYLAQGERHVDALAALSGLTKANVSQHLQTLKGVGLVTARREGLNVYYSLPDDLVIDAVAALRSVAERHQAEVHRLVDTYLKAKDSLEPVEAEELWRRAADGVVTVIDVRPAEEYEAGHIPGAIHVPLGELEERFRSIPKEKEVVAYCRGPYCVLSFEAVAKLRLMGYTTRRLKNGFPEWKRDRLPVEI
ncbi:MAG: metalloregulator ArsR/SmtB family transcription factor [Nitrospinae bacterium]|nr:metalloregulator ArsR/SmtB family transcription factor [Nitrospinota bacterium]